MRNPNVYNFPCVSNTELLFVRVTALTLMRTKNNETRLLLRFCPLNASVPRFEISQFWGTENCCTINNILSNRESNINMIIFMVLLNDQCYLIETLHRPPLTPPLFQECLARLNRTFKPPLSVSVCECLQTRLAGCKTSIRQQCSYVGFLTTTQTPTIGTRGARRESTH